MYSRSLNYPSYGKQSQSEQSSCSQCKKEYGIKQQQQQSSQLQHNHYQNESSEDEKAATHIRKHIRSHNYQIQQALRLLQYQVSTLKQQNLAKQKIIEQLKNQVQRNIKTQLLKNQMNKQNTQINRLRQQLGCSPRNNYHSTGTLFSKTQNLQNNLKTFKQKRNYNTIISDQNAQDYYSQSNQIKNYRTLKIDQVERRINIQNYDLRISVLQNHIRQYQLQISLLKKKLYGIEEQNMWQQKFIISFIKMCDQLSLNYGQRLKLNSFGNDLKKKTKISWQYMKNLIAYFINDSGQISTKTTN